MGKCTKSGSEKAKNVFIAKYMAVLIMNAAINHHYI